MAPAAGQEAGGPVRPVAESCGRLQDTHAGGLARSRNTAEHERRRRRRHSDRGGDGRQPRATLGFVRAQDDHPVSLDTVLHDNSIVAALKRFSPYEGFGASESARNRLTARDARPPGSGEGERAMSEQPLSVAVIGAGMAGRSHAAAYRMAGTVFGAGLPPIRLAAIADANTPLAEDAARRYGYEKALQSWEAVAEDPSIDAVSIVVGNALHRPISEALVAAGKHVLCEKPL